LTPANESLKAQRMQAIRRLIEHRSPWICALVALILLVRVAVPTGWMPNFAGGAVAISICSDQGRATVWLDERGQIDKSGQPNGDHKDAPCAFTSLATASLVADNLAVADLAVAPVARATPAQRVTFGHGLVAPPPPSTGPPTLI
jgi:Protein of unknown function (DUF2946)